MFYVGIHFEKYMKFMVLVINLPSANQKLLNEHMP